jgi:DNA helicase-2/ATP-dependent DNA helicase PcrA
MTQMNPVSRFVKDIPQHLLITPSGRLPSFVPRQRQTQQGFVQAAKSAAPSWSAAREATEAVTKVVDDTPLYRAGEKVIHGVFGTGVVVVCTGGPDGVVQVAFPNLGVKKLALSHAKLDRPNN